MQTKSDERKKKVERYAKKEKEKQYINQQNCFTVSNFARLAANRSDACAEAILRDFLAFRASRLFVYVLVQSSHESIEVLSILFQFLYRN